MGFTGQLVAALTDLSGVWPDAETETGQWPAGVHVLRSHDGLDLDAAGIGQYVGWLGRQSPEGFIAVSVWDSDGALLSVGRRTAPVAHHWFGLRAAIAFEQPPYAPFDDGGRPLSPEAEASLEREWEAEVAELERELRALALPLDAVATQCVEWARSSGLDAVTADRVRRVLAQEHRVFADELFYDLMACFAGGASG